MLVLAKVDSQDADDTDERIVAVVQFIRNIIGDGPRAAEESSFKIKQKQFRDPLMPACHFKSTKFLFLIEPNIVLLLFIIPEELLFDSAVAATVARLIKYSSPLPERGLTTMFRVLDNNYCYLYIIRSINLHKNYYC